MSKYKYLLVMILSLIVVSNQKYTNKLLYYAVL
jgi:hypothetical protein